MEHSFRGCFICLSVCLSLSPPPPFQIPQSLLSLLSSCTFAISNNKQTAIFFNSRSHKPLTCFRIPRAVEKRKCHTHTHARTHARTERVMSIEEFSRMVVVVVEEEDDTVVLVYFMILVVALLLTLLLVEYVCFAFVEVQALYAFHAFVVSYVTPLLQQPPRTFSLLSVCLRRALRRSSSPSSSSSAAAASPSPPSSSSP